MTAPAAPTPDDLLRQCAAAAPAPWFPSDYARTAGVPRDDLDEPLAALRLGGLVRIEGWEAGRGQGYVLTDAGRAALTGGRPAAQPAEMPAPRAGRTTAWDRGETVRSAFFADSAGSPVVFALVAVQAAVFLVGLWVVVRHN